MAIRAVFFDFGGVLYKTPDYRWLMRLSRLLRRPHDDLVWGLYTSPTQSEFVRGVMSGQIPEQQVWESFARRARLSPQWLARIRGGSYARRRLNLPAINLLKSLRPRYITAILTNAGSEFRATFVRAYGMEEWAGRVLISAEMGLAKPDPAIFTAAAEIMSVRPEEVLFLDDLLENVEGARSTGMAAIQFRSNAQAIEQVSRNLFLPS